MTFQIQEIFPLNGFTKSSDICISRPIARFCKLLDHKVSAFSNLKIV